MGLWDLLGELPIEILCGICYEGREVFYNGVDVFFLRKAV